MKLVGIATSIAAPVLLVAGAGVAVGFSACSSAAGEAPDAGEPGEPAAFSYAPEGCAHVVSPEPALGYKDVARDTGAAAAPGEPLRVRIGLGGKAERGPGYADPSTSAAFVWETSEPTDAARIRFGRAGQPLTEVRRGFSFTLPPPVLNLGGDKPQRFHEVHVCGLEPGARYDYQVGGETWSAVRSFTTAPRDGKITIGVSGDARDHVEVWQLVQRRMRELAPTVQLFTGDLVLVGLNGAEWTKWLDAAWKDPLSPSGYGPLGEQSILFVAGNHENRAARYFASAPMPGEGKAAKTFGSFDVGAVHVLFLDDQPVATDPKSELAKQTLAFVDQDLGAARRDRSRPFVVVAMHRGLYSSGPHGNDSDLLEARRALAPLFSRHRVDLVISGHDHLYERTKPIEPRGDADQSPLPGALGTTYVVCAGAGADAYSGAATPPEHREKLVAYGGATPHVGVYCMLSVEPNRLALEARALRASEGSAKGDDVVDTWEVRK